MMNGQYMKTLPDNFNIKISERNLITKIIDNINLPGYFNANDLAYYLHCAFGND
jgi:hypothetical protein